MSQYKNKLESELTLIEKELSAVGRKNPTNPKDWEGMPADMDIMAADKNEVADSLESYGENTAILNNLEIRLHEVQKAIARINDDTFGTCIVCGTPIEKERLEANPAATTCIAHKESN